MEGNGTFASNNLFRFTTNGGNNGLEFEGLKSRQFQINATLSVGVLNASGSFYAFYIAVRDSGGTTTILNESKSIVYIDSDAQIQNVGINQNIF